MLIFLPVIRDVLATRAASQIYIRSMSTHLNPPLLTFLSLRLHHIELHIRIHRKSMTARGIEQCIHCPVSVALRSAAKSGAAGIL